MAVGEVLCDAALLTSHFPDKAPEFFAYQAAIEKTLLPEKTDVVNEFKKLTTDAEEGYVRT